MRPVTSTLAVTCAVVHSGPIPAPGSVLRCTGVRRVAGKLFFDLYTVIDGAIATIELVSGRSPVKGDVLQCTRRTGTYLVIGPAPDTPERAPSEIQSVLPSKLDQVLGICASLGMDIATLVPPKCSRMIGYIDAQSTDSKNMLLKSDE